jgi:hypothetical protein
MILLFIALLVALLSGAGLYPLFIGGLISLFATSGALVANIILGILAFGQRKKYPDLYRDSPIALAMFGGVLFLFVGCLIVIALVALFIYQPDL